MKVICAPDSFKGSIDAVSAADAMAKGLRDAIDGIIIDTCPIGDGGEGTLSALLSTLDGATFACETIGMHGAPVGVLIGDFAAEGFAYVESAEAVGLQTLPTEAHDIMTASSFGVGTMIRRACETRVDRVLVGLGGSGTNDGGCGMAQALGVRFFDASGQLIDSPIAGGDLHRIQSIEPSDRFAALDEIEIVALCDVTNPLTGPDGATAVFGPQKGATRENLRQLEEGLQHLATLIARDLGIDVRELESGGAAGGLGAGMVTFAGAKIVSGIDHVLKSAHFRKRIAGADLCMTGEGRLDGQSLAGKACLGVARAAAELGVPTVALVGIAGPDASRCLEAGLTDYMVIGDGLGQSESMARVSPLLESAAAAVAKQYADNNATIGD
jgi:glycerate kinase